MVHLGRHAASSAVRNQDGQYFRPNLPIGDYRISVGAPGYKRTVRKNQAVTEVLRVDVQLETGLTAESVQVTAEVPKLQTDTRRNQHQRQFRSAHQPAPELLGRAASRVVRLGSGERVHPPWCPLSKQPVGL
jgi:hypothetical protein